MCIRYRKLDEKGNNYEKYCRAATHVTLVRHFIIMSSGGGGGKQSLFDH